jgi:hypothetical protein
MIPVLPQSYRMVVTKDSGAPEIIAVSDISQITFTGLVGIKDYEKLADVLSTFQLMQNYPNPFNPSTTIEYNIPNAGNVKVQIFDINGQILKVLDEGFKDRGSYRITWNGNDGNNNSVASGFYIYSVTFNNTNISKKLLLIK